jgi:two-component system sensor histidine kinase PilS (NtrC family)
MVAHTPSPVAGDHARTNNPPFSRWEAHRLLWIYNAYRFALALGLLALGIANSWGGITINGYHAGVAWLAIIWLASAIIVDRLVAATVHWHEGLASAVVLLDLVLTAFLARLGAELSDGFPLLYLVTVAAGAVLITQRMTATGIAAVASLGILFATASRLSTGAVATREWVTAGLLGTLIFALSLFLQQLAARLRAAEKTADKASSQIATLEELNQQIIAHMTTGVCRITAEDGVIPINDAAFTLLGMPPTPTQPPAPLAAVSTTLADCVRRWRLTPTHDFRPIIIESTGRQVLPNLLHLGNDQDPELMLFLEDFTTVSETAQVMKLKSLGKLTASIAHEIRNPLAAISHAVQLMEEPAEDAVEAETLREIIINNTRRVNDIIENVLQLSRSRTDEGEDIDLALWLPTFLSEYEQTPTGEASVALHLPGAALPIKFDRGNLSRILVNLLDNGVRHALLETGKRSATLDVTQDITGNTVYVDVIDGGGGVPEQYRERLFEPFFTTRPEGSGLGLYLSRELCEANRATLSYGQTREGYTRFRVAIPLSEGRP